MQLDHLLNFDSHISNMCKKAAMQLNILQRLSKFLNIETKLIIFKSFIKSTFNYCPIIWHFCSKSNTDKLEKLQYRALRIVYSDYTSSYNTLLSKAEVTTLHLSRQRAIAIQAFKCIHNLTPEYIRNLVKVKQSNYTLRYENILEIPNVRTTTYGKNTFRFGAAQVWNSLPNELRTVSEYKDFVRLVRTWTGPQYNFSICK